MPLSFPGWASTLLVGLSISSVGCGGDDGTAPSNPGGAGGAASAAGAASGGAGAGMTSGGATGGGSGGSAGAAAGLDCDVGLIDCNGKCIAAGDSNGKCTVLAAAGRNVDITHGLALDATHVYWSEQGANVAIARVPKAGGAREDVASADHVPLAVAVTSTSVFWTESDFSSSKLRSAPKTGGQITDLFTADDDLRDAVATETRVYFSRASFGADSDILSVPVAGATEPLLHGKTQSMYGATIVLDAQSVYWFSDGMFDASEIRKAGLEGTEQSLVASAEGLYGLALGADGVYVRVGSAVQRAPLAGGALVDVYRGPEVKYNLLAVAGSTVYFTGEGAVYAVGMDGTGLEKVLHSGGSIRRIVADDSGLYAAVNEKDDGYVIKVAP